jgi:hypothetical protein
MAHLSRFWQVKLLSARYRNSGFGLNLQSIFKTEHLYIILTLLLLNSHGWNKLDCENDSS